MAILHKKMGIQSGLKPGVKFEISSLLFFLFSAFILVSLATFSPLDPSHFHITQKLPSNACGAVGAYLAGFLIYSLGLPAYLVPAALFFIGFNTFDGTGKEKNLWVLAGMAVVVLSATLLMGVHFPIWHHSQVQLLTGGTLGYWLTEVLSQHLNRVGTTFLAMGVGGVALVLSTPIRISKWFWVGSKAIAIQVALVTYRGLSWGVRQGLPWLLKSVQSGLSKIKRNRELRRLEQAAVASQEVDEVAISQTEPELEESIPAQLESNSEPASTEIVSESPEPLAEISPEHFIPPQIQDSLFEEIPVSESKPKKKKLSAVIQNLGPWKKPLIELLKKPPKSENVVDRARLNENAKILQQKFLDLKIEGVVTNIRPGPVITLYEFKPISTIKISRIASLADDLSMALSAKSVRIVAPIPGTSVVGIEIPSDHREPVFLREFLQADDFNDPKVSIPVAMGKDLSGRPIISDLARMPHLLVAGQTGSGKSVFMNGLICSLLYRFSPEQLRMILCDPKFVEFEPYQDIPHLLLPLVDDPKNASTALKWAVREMERRYRIMAMMGMGTRNLATFNQKVDELGIETIQEILFSEENQDEKMSQIAGGDWVQAFETDENGTPIIRKLPYIVVIIDELADLMMTARKEVEYSIGRLAAKARAAGIHIVVATQRPSTDVLTGTIKTNLPSRVSFRLTTQIDSATILSRGGAEHLLGQGDMLFMAPGSGDLTRLQGAFVTDEEISKVTQFLRAQGKPNYRGEILIDDEEDEDSGDSGEGADPLFMKAIEIARERRSISVSQIQRDLRIGYNRASRMMDEMEKRRIVGASTGPSRPREVLMT